MPAWATGRAADGSVDCGAVTAGPLPPHERAWRHPTELAGPRPEPPTRAGRFLILATATFSLVLLGALAVQLAPRRTGGREEALVASTLVALGGRLAAVATAGTAAESVPRVVRTSTPPGVPGPTPTVLVGRPVAAARLAFGFASERDAAGIAGAAATSAVMVTPLAGGLAVTTNAALDGVGGRLRAVVPSGDTVVVDVLHVSGDLALVVIVGSYPGDTVVPADDPAPDELFLVVGGSVVPVHPSTLDAAAPPEGAPVIDGEGALVGLCTYGPDGVELVLVGALPLRGRAAGPPSGPAPATTVG